MHFATKLVLSCISVIEKFWLSFLFKNLGRKKRLCVTKLFFLDKASFESHILNIFLSFITESIV